MKSLYVKKLPIATIPYSLHRVSLKQQTKKEDDQILNVIALIRKILFFESFSKYPYTYFIVNIKIDFVNTSLFETIVYLSI